MVKRILALLMALVLMAAFYVYALLREDEQTKRSEEWLVTAEEQPLEKMGGLQSQDPAALARAMQMAVPLPTALLSGTVEDGAHQGGYARLLRATDGTVTVQGARPASASPLIRPQGLTFTPVEQTLHSYSLLRAQDELTAYYYLAMGAQGAFVISVPLSAGAQALQSLALFQPE